MVRNFIEPEDIEMDDAPTVLLDEDWHSGVFVNYEVLKDVMDNFHPDGIDKIMLWFEVPQENGDESVYVARRVNRSWGSRSILKQVVAQMTGKDFNDPFPMRLKELRGTKVDILISRSTNGRYNNLEKVRPAKAVATKL